MNALTQKKDERMTPTGNGTPQRVTYVSPVANILETRDGYILELKCPA